MRFFSYSTLLLILVAGCTKQPASYVDSKIGNLSGQTFPGAVCPFGMVSASPFWNYPSNEKDSIITGFGQIHRNGLKSKDVWGGPSIMPFSGDFYGDMEEVLSSYNDEKASPGYYSVFLKTYNILAEMTTTSRTSRYRFTFNQTDQAFVALDLSKHLNNAYDKSYIKVISLQEAEGYLSEGGMNNDRSGIHNVYFVIRFLKHIFSYLIHAF